MIFSALTLLLSSLLPLSQAQDQPGLARHNTLRALHQNTGPVTWSTSLASSAQTHVSACRFELSSGRGYGQNLGAGSFANAEQVVQYWYDVGATKYNYSNPGFSQETGTFTQVVWKATTEVGCGAEDCDGRNGVPGILVACFYTPPGNVQGRFAANVLPPKPAAVGGAAGGRQGGVADAVWLASEAV